MKLEHLLIFGAVMVVAWFLAIYFWPRVLLSVFKRAILVKGFGDGPIPVNWLYVQSQALFADPLGATAGSKLATTGVNLTPSWQPAGWISEKDLNSCTYRTRLIATTASSSPTRPRTSISRMSAPAPQAPRRATPHHRAELDRAGSERDDADLLAQ